MAALRLSMRLDRLCFRIALLSALLAAIALCGFDPADPWTHATWFLTMGLLGTWVGGILGLMFRLAQNAAVPGERSPHA